MLVKLIKYELYYYATRLGAIFLGILFAFCVALLSKHYFRSANWLFQMIDTGITISFLIAIAIALCTLLVITVIRFYSYLFSSEGYLHLALPVTPAKFFYSKLIVSAVLIIVFLCFSIFSFVILTDSFLEIASVFELVFDQLSLPLFIFFFLISAFTGLVQYYSAICIGHKMGGNIAACVLSYLAINYGGQLLLTIIFFITFIANGMFQPTGTIINEVELIVSVLGLSCIFYAILNIFLCLLSGRILNKHINLP